MAGGVFLRNFFGRGGCGKPGGKKNGAGEKKSSGNGELYGEEPYWKEKVPVEEIRPLRELENLEIEKALRLFGDHTEGKKQAARALGISLATLYRKLGG